MEFLARSKKDEHCSKSCRLRNPSRELEPSVPSRRAAYSARSGAQSARAERLHSSAARMQHLKQTPRVYVCARRMPLSSLSLTQLLVFFFFSTVFLSSCIEGRQSLRGDAADRKKKKGYCFPGNKSLPVRRGARQKNSISLSFSLNFPCCRCCFGTFSSHPPRTEPPALVCS